MSNTSKGSYKYLKIVSVVAVIVTAIIYKETLEEFYRKYYQIVNTKVKKTGNLIILSPEELSQYNGIEKKKLYLSFLGNVFDVTKQKKHYAPGSDYNYFIGKDGSRAFITGNFQDETEKRDHVLDLSCGEIDTLVKWKDTYYERYLNIGVLIGRYYNDDGEATPYSHQLTEKLLTCEKEKEKAIQHDLKYPPCNIEWVPKTGTRVWCTKSSGGVSRSWVGVPRSLYTPGEVSPKCVCVQNVQDEKMGRLNQYENCSPIATSCSLLDI